VTCPWHAGGTSLRGTSEPPFDTLGASG
jgi:hypothetical protein